MKEKFQSVQPVFSIDPEQFVIPQGEELRNKILALKKEKKVTLWVDTSASEVLHPFADAVFNTSDYPAMIEKFEEMPSLILILQTDRAVAERFYDHFLQKKNVIFLNAGHSFTEEEILTKLYKALHYELPEEANRLDVEKMKTKISLSDIKIFAYHGVLEEERVIGTDYLVNIEIEADVRKATESDDINDTISYAEINNIVHEEMKISSQLIEHVAGRIFRSVKSKFADIQYIKVGITKCSAPMQGENAGATICIEQRF